MDIRKHLLLLCALIMSIPTFSQVGGNNTYEFLNLPISARVTALGGNLLSTRDNDLNVALVNPALLTDTMDSNLALSYINYFTDINYGYVAFAKNLRENQNLSIGMQYLNYGEFIRADVIGNNLGTFTADEMSLNVSYARSIYDSNLFVGATVKTIYSNLDNYISFGSALDLGAVYSRPHKNFSVALVIKNVGYQWKPYTKGNREKLPFEMQIGFSKQPKHVPFRISVVYENIERWDLTYTNTNDPNIKVDPNTGAAIDDRGKLKVFSDQLMRHIVFGGEFIVTKNFFVRIGYNYQRRKELRIVERAGMTGFSFGFGFRVYKFHISYGRASYNLAGASNNFSVSFDMNSFYKKAKSIN